MKSVNGGGGRYCPDVHTIYSDNFNIVIVIIHEIYKNTRKLNFCYTGMDLRLEIVCVVAIAELIK